MASPKSINKLLRLFHYRVTKMLAKVLRIGKEPDKYGQNYQPIMFNTEFKYDFFPELFCRVMWLLSKTRREMRACTYDDYDKVIFNNTVNRYTNLLILYLRL